MTRNPPDSRNARTPSRSSMPRAIRSPECRGLRLQIATGNIQAGHAALSQALVVRARVRHPVPRLLALARFALFQSRFIWHYLHWLYDVVFLHNPRQLRNTPPSEQSLFTDSRRMALTICIDVQPRNVTC